MRAFLIALSLVSLAAVGSQPVQADPQDTFLCLVNALLVSNPAERIAACLANAAADAPLCLEVFVRSTSLHQTYPCNPTCQSQSSTQWAVAVVAFGSPGDTVRGVLECNGAVDVEATATVGSGGVGGRIESDTPSSGTMVCRQGPPPPASVSLYIVGCFPL